MECSNTPEARGYWPATAKIETYFNLNKMFTVFMFTVVYSVVLLHFHIINFQRWTYFAKKLRVDLQGFAANVNQRC